jgi:flagellar protein FliJ
MTSLSNNVLNTLLKLAEETLDSAMEYMVKTKKALDEAEEKGVMLRGYRQDYVDNLGKLLKKGLGKEAHNNYQNFLKKLDQAISGQEELIVGAQYQHDKQREIWQQAQRKKLSYEVLLKRTKKKAHLLATKKDQKMTDEYATRAKRAHHTSNF